MKSREVGNRKKGRKTRATGLKLKIVCLTRTQADWNSRTASALTRGISRMAVSLSSFHPTPEAHRPPHGSLPPKSSGGGRWKITSFIPKEERFETMTGEEMERAIEFILQNQATLEEHVKQAEERIEQVNRN